MKLIDKVKFVVAFPPFDAATAIDNTTYAKGDYVHMANYNQLTVVILGGASAGGTGVINIYQATSAAGGSAKVIPGLTTRYLCTATATASDAWVKTAVTSSTWTHPATANLYNIVDLHISQFDLANGFEWAAVNIAAAGGTTLMAGLYILSDPRYISAEYGSTSNLTSIA